MRITARKGYNYESFKKGADITRITLSGDQYVLFILFFKMGIMASIAGALVTSNFFKSLIYLPLRRRRENLQFTLIFGSLLACGAAVRVLVGYEGVDLSLSGVFLIGLLSGVLPGMSAGVLVSLPGLYGGEWLALPFLVVCGAVGGVIGRDPGRRDELWNFTPFLAKDFIRSIKIMKNEHRVDVSALVLVSVLSLDILRTVMAIRVEPAVLFAFTPDFFLMHICVWGATLVCVAIPLKIWNNTRVELLLEEQRSAAIQARFDALRRQINPHFLFNTLNTATSCLWSDPDKARSILVKLSTILRRLLHNTGDFQPLSREIEFIDDYVSLEQARFGTDNIRMEKEIDPRVLDVPVPSMLLQPLVENAIRHGISLQVGGGKIVLSVTRLEDDRISIRVGDDGIGFNGKLRKGVGLSNVQERLRVAYGSRGTFRIDSVPGEGTEVYMEFPVERGTENA
ncbi:MAG: histidine kinase [Candidatus Krumholzibacteriota bacterium]|nr:histidine kinase [Candidatus Krumholzibacteriota bacterium]